MTDQELLNVYDHARFLAIRDERIPVGMSHLFALKTLVQTLIPDGMIVVPQDAIIYLDGLVKDAGTELEYREDPWGLISDLYSYEWPWEIIREGDR